MSNNFQPAEDIFDDVEGHMPRIRLPLEADETPVEGHRINQVDNDEDDDVEGHRINA